MGPNTSRRCRRDATLGAACHAARPACGAQLSHHAAHILGRRAASGSPAVPCHHLLELPLSDLEALHEARAVLGSGCRKQGGDAGTWGCRGGLLPLEHALGRCTVQAANQHALSKGLDAAGGTHAPHCLNRPAGGERTALGTDWAQPVMRAAARTGMWWKSRSCTSLLRMVAR